MRSFIEFISGKFKSILGDLLRLSNYIALSIVMLCIMFSGCSNKEPVRPDNARISDSSLRLEPNSPESHYFTINAKYRKIRSYPEGGGVFIVRAAQSNDLFQETKLSINADAELNARIDVNEINRHSGTAEITIQPEQSIEIGVHLIMVYATRSNVTRAVELRVDAINWPSGDPQIAIEKRDEFVEWLETEHPEFGKFSGRDWFPYMTYPGILVVEHWTFLDQDWEMRVCFHVMIPPYDWSMILLRQRGEWDPILAAKRESDGTIYEIPVGDYPIFFSY